jgi:uncharacterized OB-fold protein
MAETASPFAGDGPERQFRTGLAAGEFNIQRCGGCGKYVFYPRALCNHCGSPELKWEKASGDGTVYSTSIERTKPEAGGDKNIAVVELAEGPRLLTRITDIAPAEVKIGMKVTAHIGEADGIKMILFRKA